MTPENKNRIRQRLTEAAGKLEGLLPDNPMHPTGRNPYAHIPSVIKNLTGGVSYKNLPDEAFVFIMELIQYCEENPF